MDVLALIDRLSTTADAEADSESSDLDVLSFIDRQTPIRKDEHRHRGTAAAKCHGRFMRAHRRINHLEGSPATSAHVASQLVMYNRDYAVRPGDVINDVQAGRPRVSGQGRWKQWVPSAVLRCCFGSAVHAMQSQPTPSARSRPRAENANVGAASVRLFSSFFRASHGYVGRIRQAVAAWLYDAQVRMYEERNTRGQPVAHRITTLSVDETEFQLLIGHDHGTVPVMMMHGSVFDRMADQTCRHEDVALPPAALQDQTGKTLLTSIMGRAAFLFDEIQGASFRCTILCSDSAATLVGVGHHYQLATKCSPTHVFLHARCYMHRLWGAFSGAIQGLEVINPMFSATCLTHKVGMMVKIRQAVAVIVRARLRVQFCPGSVEQVARNEQIISLLEAAEDEVGRLTSDNALHLDQQYVALSCYVLAFSLPVVALVIAVLSCTLGIVCAVSGQSAVWVAACATLSLLLSCFPCV